MSLCCTIISQDYYSRLPIHTEEQYLPNDDPVFFSLLFPSLLSLSLLRMNSTRISNNLQRELLIFILIFVSFYDSLLLKLSFSRHPIFLSFSLFLLLFVSRTLSTLPHYLFFVVCFSFLFRSLTRFFLIFRPQAMPYFSCLPIFFPSSSCLVLATLLLSLLYFLFPFLCFFL